MKVISKLKPGFCFFEYPVSHYIDTGRISLQNREDNNTKHTTQHQRLTKKFQIQCQGYPTWMVKSAQASCHVIDHTQTNIYIMYMGLIKAERTQSMYKSTLQYQRQSFFDTNTNYEFSEQQRAKLIAYYSYILPHHLSRLITKYTIITLWVS